MRYRFTGPVPVADEAGELVHPLDIREFDQEPDWGPWDLLDGPGPAEAAAGAAASAMTQVAADIRSAQPAVSAAVASLLTPKGM